MKIAVISFDPNIAEIFRNTFGEDNVRIYIDSISMLKEIEEFNPTYIVYDASAGDFAFDDLKFLLSRDKVKDKIFKVLYSEEQPLVLDELENVSNIDFYKKESQIEDLIEDILKTEKAFSEKEEKEPPAIAPKEVEQLQEDIPSLQEPPKTKPKQTQELPIDKLCIELDKREIKDLIITLTVEKLVNQMLESQEIKEFVEAAKKEFIKRLTKELESIAEEIRVEVKRTVFKQVEDEIIYSLKTDLKDYIANITAKLIKEKIDQAFGR